MPTQTPVIVIPGITASVFKDRYPIEPEEVWTAVLRKSFERITLHPDDLRFESIEPARVGPQNPFSLAYDDLAGAKRLITTANTLDLESDSSLPEGKARWLAIVGLDAKTLLKVEVEMWKGGPWFKLVDPENRGPKTPDTGDGTVPFPGACPRFLELERLVGVTPGDFSMWEVADQAAVRLAGFHGMLPNMNLVQRLAIRHLRDDFDADLWGHVVPGGDPPRWPKWLNPKGD